MQRLFGGSGAGAASRSRASRLLRRLGLVRAGVLVLGLSGLAATGAIAAAVDFEQTDPARNTPLPCELVDTPGTPARSSKNIEHLANVCGIVGTDVEFQSRKDARGKVHDYAFVGTMGAGMQIYDVTDPDDPAEAGGFVDSGWQNDVQVKGDVATVTFDGVSGEDSSLSTCLKTKYPGSNGQGVDILKLDFDPQTARFDVTNPTCVANPPGGAHNATLHPRAVDGYFQPQL